MTTPMTFFRTICCRAMVHCMIFLLSLAASAAQAAPLAIPRINAAPTIDGSAQDAAWQSQPWRGDFRALGKSDVAASVQTRFKLVHDGFRLYAIIKATEPHTAKLRAVSSNIRDDLGLWRDDCVQLQLDPGGRGLGYFQFIVTWKGTVVDILAEDDNRGVGTFAMRPERNADVHAAAQVDKGCWYAELSAPFAALGLRADVPKTWGVNICRSRYAGTLEHSASSHLHPDRGFGQPDRYLRAVLADFAPAPFQWTISRPQTKVVKGPSGLVCQACTTIQNQTGEFCILNVTAQLDGKPVVQELFLKHLQEGQAMLDLPFAKPGEYRLRLTLARRALPDMALARAAFPLALDYQPLRLKLLQPAYRNCIFASQKLKTVRAQITTEADYTDRPLTVTLSGQSIEPVQHAFSRAGEVREVEFNAVALPEGRYALTASLPGAPTAACDLRKLPHLPGEVWLDARGNPYVDGEPFLPFGWFGAPFDEAPEMTAVHTYGIWSDVSAIRRALDRAQAAGKKLVLTPFHGEKRWDDPIKEEARCGAFTGVNEKRVRYVINAIKDHPAILAWYMADEPEGRRHSVEWYKSAYALLREIDPHHPCIMLNYGLRGIRTYYEGCDLLMPDCYPVFREDGTTRKPLWALTEWTEAARALRPTWLVPQVFDWDGTGTITSPGRPPTFDESRNQIWQALAAGARGILMFSYRGSRTSHELRIGAAHMAREALAFKPALFGQDLRDKLKVQSTPQDEHFATALLRFGDDLLLIAVNTAYQARSARFQFDTPVPGDTLYVVGEKRSVAAADGAFTDEFAPIATHLYTTSRQRAGAIDLADIRQKIAVAEKSRVKPGNLVGLGGMPRHKFKATHEAPPEGRPVVTYSSWRVFYSNVNKPWHLLYIFDGLSHEALHRSWVPIQSDKKPWLEVALPKQGPVGRVCLFTPFFEGQAKLRGCRVLLRLPDGSLKMAAEITGNTAHEIKAQFTAEVAKAVRVEITDFTTEFPGHGETGLITEFEVYAK